MRRFTDVSTEELDTVLEEFYRNSVMSEEGVSISSSPDFVKNALTKALGADKAKELSDNLRAGEEEAGLDALRFAEPIMISNYIRNEHPQTIALILSYMNNVEQSSTVLRELPESVQADVLYRMAVIESIPPGVVSEMNEVLTEEMKTAGRMATSVGGVEPVAEILNSVDKATETRILTSIEETNPDLAEQIRELMFTFEDMALIDAKQMQLVMKDVDQADMVLALKTASDAVKELIFSSMSSRATVFKIIPYHFCSPGGHATEDKLFDCITCCFERKHHVCLINIFHNELHLLSINESHIFEGEHQFPDLFCQIRICFFDARQYSSFCSLVHRV
jgi:flagellar motor switch protein FliG